MRIVFLTTDDPLYLPVFFERVLDERASDTVGVYVVPPLYKGQTARKAASRYARTFGVRNAALLALKTARAKLARRSIAAVCERRGVPNHSLRDVNAPAFLGELRRSRIDTVVSVSCPQIFKRDLIELPERGCLNVHGAVLPHYRGVMPSFWMLANGERRAGVSIYFVNEAIDAGDLCGQRTFEIRPQESLDAFLRRSKAIAADLLLDVLRDLESGRITRTPLDLSTGSYYSWPDRAAVARFHAAGHRVW